MDYGLYIHIPYCKSRCRYCDFYTAGASGEVPQRYIQAVIDSFACFAPKDSKGQTAAPATVYFGGGTPGLLSPVQAAQLLEAFAPLPGAEITLETNPETTTPEKLAGWREAGINRLSMGVQTASDESLRRLGRLHTADGAAQALRQAKQAGFSNISGDIMLALPQYTTQEFDQTLALLAEGGASHISAYLLKIEPGTPFGKNPPPGLPNGDEAAEFYEYAAGRLQNRGFARYEISNFAKPGFEGRHNMIYWDCGDYLGIGPAAHSCMDGKRFYFAADTHAFMDGSLPPTPDGECTAEDYVMLQLRLEKGLDTGLLLQRFGRRLSPAQEQKMQQFCAAGLAAPRPQGSGWVLTTKGLLVQNALLASLLE